MTKAGAGLMAAQPGDKFKYDHPSGFGYGEHNKNAAGFGEMTAEMTELDLKDGMGVTFVDFDVDTGWPIVSWTDSTGINRITTIDEQYVDLFPPA
jgi:hypothetical protein